ncbi:hypothetical protein V8G54_034174 [Vigna mungo]|uniref:Uncharacterized protein n=1 Tax=Vigna mungo TaxID=3915 RepID=A0AAQ3MPQ0_VIGMU
MLSLLVGTKLVQHQQEKGVKILRSITKNTFIFKICQFLLQSEICIPMEISISIKFSSSFISLNSAKRSIRPCCLKMESGKKSGNLDCTFCLGSSFKSGKWLLGRLISIRLSSSSSPS